MELVTLGMTTIDYVVFISLLAISLLIGAYYGLFKRQKSTADYLVGGRSMPVVPTAVSLLASYVSAILILGVPSEFFYHGSLLWESMYGNIIVFPLAAYIFIPTFYRLKLTSVYEYLELRFESRVVRLLASLTFSIQAVLYLGVVVFAPSIALHTVAGFPHWASILCIGGVGTLYTAVGGLRAVVWTDVLQCLLMFGGLLAIIIQGSIELGGLGEAFRISGERGRLQFLESLLINIPLLTFIVSLGWIAGVVIFATYADCDPLLAGYVNSKDAVVPYFVLHRFAKLPGMLGLFIASLLSGALSSVSSLLNALAAVAWEDVASKIDCISKKGEAAKLATTKALGFGFGFITIGLAFAVSNMTGLIQTTFTLTGAVSGPLLGTFLLALFIPWANKYGAILGILCGHATSMYISFGALSLNRKPAFLPRSIDGCSATSPVILANNQTWCTSSRVSAELLHPLVQRFATSNYDVSTSPTLQIKRTDKLRDHTNESKEMNGKKRSSLQGIENRMLTDSNENLRCQLPRYRPTGEANNYTSSAYVMCTMGIGVYSRFSGTQFNRSKAGFSFATGNVSSFAVLLSIARTGIGIRVFLGIPAELYYHGAGMWEGLYGVALSLIVVSVVFMPVYFAMPTTSIYEYLELRFKSGLVRRLASMLYVVRSILMLGVTTFTPCVAIRAVVGVPYWISILGVGVLSMIFTAIGGMRGVILNDVLQVIALFGCTIAIVVSASLKLPNGIIGAFQLAAEKGRLNFFNFDPDPTIRVTTISALLGQVFSSTTTYGCQQAFAQKYRSLPNAKIVTRTLICASPLVAFMESLLWVGGVVLFALYAHCDPLTARFTSKIDDIVPYFVQQEFSAVPGLSCCINIELRCHCYLGRLSEQEQICVTFIRRTTSIFYGFAIMGMAMLASTITGLIEASQLGAICGLMTSLALTLIMTIGRTTVTRGVVKMLPLSVDQCPVDPFLDCLLLLYNLHHLLTNYTKTL
ncbi:hypothetical protein B566_EDAN001736 [Ephemera danica]|nr:hypothetical protein B566_EDAN001736 [Ephemera danica]